MTSDYNLLSNALIRVTVSSGGNCRFSLPGLLAALMRDEIAAFPALRPHQRHAWHAFLVQLGALALLSMDRQQPPETEKEWGQLLRTLTPDHLDDAPWRLVSALNAPALLQAPVPGGSGEQFQKPIDTPDALDILVTASNHELKREVMETAAADDWLFALATLQTMQGIYGRSNYGVSRMNRGYGNRPALGIVPPGGPGAHVRRDIGRLIELRGHIPGHAGFRSRGGLGLVWLLPWDGTTSLKSSELDPYYIEICRRVRLIGHDDRLQARLAGSKVPRITPFEGGVTGDPWAPVLTDASGAQRVLTIDAQGFGYQRMVQLMFRGEIGGSAVEPSPLQVFAPSDANEGLTLVARALTRGEGKTEGYHERRVRISNRVRRSFMRLEDAEPVAKAAQERVLVAGQIQRRVLKPALLALLENGPDTIDFRKEGADRRAQDFLMHFDQLVDRDFFPDLWEEFEEDDVDAHHQVRSRWVQALLKTAEGLLRKANESASKGLRRRYRSWARAQSLFHGAARRNEYILPHLPARSPENASVEPAS
jgi:CRISPR system Cascade subunit CasA